MTTQLLVTKLHIPPPRPNLVPRPHLLKRLDDGLRLGRKLTLLSAPAGFGKTTLLSEWVAATDTPVAWLELDSSDNDPTRLWSYAIAALQTVYPELGSPAMEMIRSPQPPAIEAPLVGLINEMAEIPSSLIVVLDDFHVITNPQINQAAGFLLEHLPRRMHLVVSTRADPPWSLARLRARRQMTELRADDLRFTASETAAFFNDVMKLDLPSDAITALENRTEGWIAGLQLAALSMRGQSNTTAFIEAFSGSHRFVLDYLLEEVLHQQPDDVRDFLLRTSILEQLTAPLCDAVTARDDSRAVLTRLDQSNLFLVPLDDERRWYRYHHLFAGLLQAQLAETSPQIIPGLHQRASAWYEQAGLPERAIHHALTGEDPERAADLVEQHALSALAQGKQVALSWWLEALPDRVVNTRPGLCVYHAWTRYWVGMRQEGARCLHNAETALVHQSSPETPAEKEPAAEDRQLIEGRLAAIQAYYALTDEDALRAKDAAMSALEILPEGDYMRSMAALALGGAYWGQGDVGAARHAFATASTTAQASGYRLLAVSAACYEGIQQTKQGLLQDAFHTYERAARLAIAPDGRQLPAAGYPLIKLGDLLREWDRLDEADVHLTRGLELCTQWGQADILVDGYVALGRLNLALGDVATATAYIEEGTVLARRTRIDPWVQCWLADAQLRLWLATGELTTAAQWAEASGLKTDDPLSYQHDLHHINLARQLTAQGIRDPFGPHLDQALHLLDRLLRAAQAAAWKNKAIQILILEALARQAGGDENGAMAALSDAMALAQPAGYVRTFIDESTPMGKLLQQASIQGLAGDYPARLLTALANAQTVAPTPPPSDRRRERGADQDLIEHLTEREMEVLQLLPSRLTSAEIAVELVVSVHTVRSHIKNIYGKLGVHKRVEAVERAKRLGLL